jgi:crotonobetainyl-CoA:carnitine CoA-transferase CaiB-like acyl-CoA transferase
MVLSAQMDAFWVKFCRAAGRPELAEDPRYRTVQDRSSHFAEVERLVSEIMLTRTRAEWTALLSEADVPHAPVNSVGEALEQPHAVERGLVRTIDQPGHGPVRVPGPVIRFLASEPADEIGPAPRLGEHTRSVLTDALGLSSAEIDELVAHGVIGEGPA